MDVSFSERFSNVLALQQMLARCTEDAQGQAKRLEQSAYERASSTVIMPRSKVSNRL